MAKVDKKSKNTHREGIPSLIYQQELFDHVDEKGTEESKEFREYIKMKISVPVTMPIKVINLLTKCCIGSEILERSKECFRVLKEILLYLYYFPFYTDIHLCERNDLTRACNCLFDQIRQCKATGYFHMSDSH